MKIVPKRLVIKNDFEKQKLLLENEKLDNEKKWQKYRFIFTVLNIIPVLFSLYLTMKNIDILYSENEFNKRNSYPSFEFSQEDIDSKKTKFQLALKSGEMNNLNFSVSSIITGSFIYDGKRYEITHRIIDPGIDNEGKDKFSFTTAICFDPIKVETAFIEFAEKENINIDKNSLKLTSTQYYEVTYMNFEHEQQNEYYLNMEGRGQATESPFSKNTSLQNDSTILIHGSSFSESYKDTSKKIAGYIFENFKYIMEHMS